MKHAPTIIVLALLFLLPVAVLILQAGAPGWRFPELWPELTFDGLRFLAARPGPFLTALASSLGYSLATVAVTLAMTILPAQVLAFRTFPGKNLLEGLLLLPALVPAMTFSMGLHFIFIKIGMADTTIAELYRQKRSSKIDSLELHVLESVGRLVFSFYEVTAVFPGNGFACIDILTGSSHRVTDHSASEWLAQGSILFCAISRVDDVEFLSAASPISFPLPWKTHVIDLRTSLIGQKNALSTEDLPDYEFEIREVFLELYAAAINPPSLSNTDGDPLSLQTLHYRISSPKDAFDALVHLCVTESPEQLLENADYTESGELAGVTIPWSRLEAAKTTPMSNTILGYIDIERESMTVEVNSDKRAAEIREIIQNAIGDKAHYKTTSIKPVRTPGERAEDDDDPLGCHNKMMQDPAVREHMENMFLDHWGQWVDTPLPILDGQTPREAAKSPSGREKVDALIRSAFLNSERSPDLEVQKKGIDRARTELGL